MAILDLFTNSSFLNFTKGLGGALGSYSASQSEANAYKSSAKQALQVGDYNSKIIDFNTNRALASLYRQIKSTSSASVQAAGSSGVNVASQSFLSTLSNNMADFERQIVETKNSASISKESTLFQARSAAAAYKTKERATRSSGLTSLISKTPSLLSQASNLFGGK